MIEVYESQPMMPEEPLRGVDDGLADRVARAHIDLQDIEKVNAGNIQLIADKHASELSKIETALSQAEAGRDERLVAADAAREVAKAEARAQYERALAAADEQHETDRLTAEADFAAKQADSESARADADAAHEAARIQQTEERKTIEATRQTLRELERTYASTHAAKSGIEEQLNDAKVALATLGALKANNQQTIESIGGQLTDLIEAIDGKKTELDQKENDNKQLYALRTQLSKMRHTAESATDIEGTHEQTAEPVGDALAATVVIEAASPEERQAMAGVVEMEIENSLHELSKLRGELGGLETDRKKLSDQLPAKSIESSDLEKSIKLKIDEIKAYDTAIDETKTALAEVRQQIVDLAEYIERELSVESPEEPTQSIEEPLPVNATTDVAETDDARPATFTTRVVRSNGTAGIRDWLTGAGFLEGAVLVQDIEESTERAG